MSDRDNINDMVRDMGNSHDFSYGSTSGGDQSKDSSSGGSSSSSSDYSSSSSNDGGGGGGGGGGAADVTVPAATGEDQSSGLIPNPNGFAFPNFGSAATPEVFNEADLVEMFGNTPDVCVDGADPCVATAEAAGWARMVNESRAAGHCEGFAVLAASRFMASSKTAL